MMKKLTIIITALTLITIPISSFAEKKTALSWYIGFGVGSGISFGEGEAFYEEGDTIAVPLVLNFGVGFPVAGTLTLGFDYISFSHFADYSVNDKEETRVLSIDNFYVALMYFPGGNRFFLKGALGWSYLGDWEYDFIDSTATFYGGPGITAGTGYFFPLGETLNLGLHLEYSRAWFGSGPYEYTDMGVLYVSLYWL